MVTFIEGEHPELGALVAAIDPNARYVVGKPASRRFAALLTPYQTHEAAVAGVTAAGAQLKEQA